MTPILGQRYRYSLRGEILTHRNLIGVASNIQRLGAIYSCTLSNLTGWTKLGIATQIEVLSTELEEVEESPREAAPAAPEDAYDGPEAALVQGIIATLKEHKYVCAVVGQGRAKGSGTTVGYPDLSVRREGWPCGMCVLLEVKAKGGSLSPEQEEMFTGGWSYVVRSVDSTMEALRDFEDTVASWQRWSHKRPTSWGKYL